MNPPPGTHWRFSQERIDRKELERTIPDLHGSKARWIESSPVKEVFGGEPAWEGVVEVFDLQGHPTSTRCYAWSYRIGHSRKRRFFAVLHERLVNSPQAAVRAAIVSEFRKWKPTN